MILGKYCAEEILKVYQNLKEKGRETKGFGENYGLYESNCMECKGKTFSLNTIERNFCINCGQNKKD